MVWDGWVGGFEVEGLMSGREAEVRIGIGIVTSYEAVHSINSSWMLRRMTLCLMLVI